MCGRNRLDARLRYHMESGVQILMARERRTYRLLGIYACTLIDYLPIPQLPQPPFPPHSNYAARRFLSDVKVGGAYLVDDRHIKDGVGTA